MRRGTRWVALCGGVSLLTGCVTESKVVSPDTVPPHLVKQAPAPVERAPKPSTLVAAGAMYTDQGVAAKDPAARQLYFEQAKRVYQQALAHEPGNTQALIGLARVHEKQGLLTAAYQQYEQLLQQCPQDAALHHEYGWCLARNKQWAQAAACFQRASEIDPGNSKFIGDWGHTLARAERFEDSLGVFRRQMGEGQACYRVALMAKHLKREDVCRHYLQLAIQHEPQMQEAKQLLADMSAGSATPVVTVSQETPPPMLPMVPATEAAAPPVPQP